MRLRGGWGMVEVLTLQIGAIILIQTLILLWGGRQIISIMSQGLSQLDGNIAQAIKQLLEQGMGEFEPPNPILQAIAARLAQQPPQEMVEVRPIDSKGRFT